MITPIKGNIFNANTNAIVNTVNCVGVMGKGIALEFKARYPNMFKDYVVACKNSEVKIGKMWIWNNTATPKYIINFPTKEHWQNHSRIEWISSGLDNLKECVQQLNISSLSLPPLGCGNGGLDFNVIKQIIEGKLNDLTIPVFLYYPKYY